MKGVVNKGIGEFAIQQFGEEAWTRIKAAAGCEEPFFSTSASYDDQSTLDLVTAACEVSGLTAAQVLEAYGRFLIPNTMRDAYPSFFAVAGKSARELLMNLDRVHQEVTKHVAGSAPPLIVCTETADGTLHIRYSGRGFCELLKGALAGVGVMFGESLEVREISCSTDTGCLFEVQLS